ncbi:MAG TPA: hypothetical protein VN493_15805 [Thermoanaerobaculia bacterium]|nr:hypothetical protein [Thermoanaerobaculia bacterium]
MRSLCAFAFALITLALAPAALEAADGVTFHSRPLQAGEAHRVITGGFFDFALTVAADGKTLGSQDVKTRMTETYRVEVLEANAAGPTLARVRYFQSESHVSPADGPEQKEVEPAAGKTFLVNATRVTDERGGPADPKAAVQVAGDFALLARAEPFCRFLDGRTVALGETLEIEPGTAGLFLGISEVEEEVQQLALTLREVAPRQGMSAAVFEMQVRSTSRRMEGAVISVQAAGLATVSADCRLLSMEMAGPLTIAGSSQEEGKTIDVRGTGRVKMVVRLEYDR